MNVLDWDAMTWIHPPAATRHDGHRLEVTTADRTDWWRLTGYGFDHRDGHLLAAPLGDGTAIEVTFRAQLTHQYDQAGLMLYASDTTWIKAGLERDGRLYAAVVVTHDRSDWSVAEIAEVTPGTPVTIRASRRGDAVTFRYGIGAEPPERLLRLAWWPPELATVAGPMTCSPTRSGLVTTFDPVRSGPADPAEA